MRIVSKTNSDEQMPEPIKDLDADYIEAHKMILEKLPEVLKDYKFETSKLVTNFGTELYLKTNAPKKILYKLSKELGVPAPYGEWLIEWAFSDSTDEEKLEKGIYPIWMIWGVRADYVKATNGFNKVVNWVESLGCKDCVPYKETSERINFCKLHTYRRKKKENEEE